MFKQHLRVVGRGLGRAAVAVAAVGAAGVASGSDVTVQFSQPTGDRWMYPFGQGPGAELRAPSFSTIGQTMFDDRDSEFLVMYDTDGAVQLASGAPPESYRVRSVRLRVFTSSDLTFEYDPTPDSVRNFLPQSNPNFVADVDAGRTVDLFGVGFRNQFVNVEFQENSPFPFGSTTKGTRNAYPAVFDEAGVPTDVSNDVVQQIDYTPFAIGTIAGVTPGHKVPALSEMVFDVSVCDPAVRAYVRRGLSVGRLYFLVSTLQPGTGGPGGGSGVTYPDFVTKEAFPGFSAKLEVTVTIGDLADVTGDGEVELDDFFGFFNAFDAGSTDADVNADCAVDLVDFFDFLNAWAAA